MSERELLPCPCGIVPDELSLSDNGQGGKWANATGDCCGEWSVEFRTGYYRLDSKDAMDLAVNAWNKSPRAALSQPAPKIGCTERCQRIHPHCELSISRSGAPDHFWHWIVTMPDGHIWDVKGGMTFSEAVESMKADGLYSLEKADERWRETHAAQPPQASEPAEPHNALGKRP